MTQPSHLPNPVCRECESSKSWVSRLPIPWILHLTSHLLYPRPPVLSALGILRAHGLLGCQLYDVTRVTLVSKLLYASSAWWGFANAETRKRFQSVLNRCYRLGFLPSDSATFETLVLDQCSTLFNDIENNNYHVLHQLLPPIRSTPYDFRPRSSQRSIPMSNDRMRKTFLCRQLLLDSKNI